MSWPMAAVLIVSVIVSGLTTVALVYGERDKPDDDA